MLAIGLALKAAWSAVSAGLSVAAEWFSDLPRGVKISIIAALALLLWTWAVNDRAYDRGETAGLAARAAELRLCEGNVSALEAGIASANEAAERAAREATERATEAASIARGTLMQAEQKRAREALRSPGADQMNAFMREMFQ